MFAYNIVVKNAANIYKRILLKYIAQSYSRIYKDNTTHCREQ